MNYLNWLDWQKKKEKKLPPNFFTKSLKLAKWTCLPNLVILAHWEVEKTKLINLFIYLFDIIRKFLKFTFGSFIGLPLRIIETGRFTPCAFKILNFQLCRLEITLHVSIYKIVGELITDSYLNKSSEWAQNIGMFVLCFPAKSIYWSKSTFVTHSWFSWYST